MKPTPSDFPPPWHHFTMSQVWQRLQTNCQRGLDAAEAMRRSDEYGLNLVTARYGVPRWKRFLLQMAKFLRQIET